LPGRFSKDGCQQGTRAAADIHHRIHGGPVVRVGNLLVFVTAQIG
jgi:hypothetical protein